MKVIIAGSRTFERAVWGWERFDQAVASTGLAVTEVVSGCCRGADLMGEAWARRHGVPVKRFPADWKVHGKAAGPIRNREMADYADAAVVFWDGESRGARNMVEEMELRGKPVKVILFGSISGEGCA